MQDCKCSVQVKHIQSIGMISCFLTVFVNDGKDCSLKVNQHESQFIKLGVITILITIHMICSLVYNNDSNTRKILTITPLLSNQLNASVNFALVNHLKVQTLNLADSCYMTCCCCCCCCCCYTTHWCLASSLSRSL